MVTRLQWASSDKTMNSPSMRRNLTSLEFQEGSKPPLEPFGMVRIIAKSDKCSKRLKLDILDQQTFEKQASCYGK